MRAEQGEGGGCRWFAVNAGFEGPLVGDLDRGVHAERLRVVADRHVEEGGLRVVERRAVGEAADECLPNDDVQTVVPVDPRAFVDRDHDGFVAQVVDPVGVVVDAEAAAHAGGEMDRERHGRLGGRQQHEVFEHGFDELRRRAVLV